MATAVPTSPAASEQHAGSHPVPFEMEKIDFHNLPCPTPFQDTQLEASVILKPDYFEGMRFDLVKPFSPKFAFTHSIFMGPIGIPSQNSENFKVPTASYEFGASIIDTKSMLSGRIQTDGNLNVQFKNCFSENLALKGQAYLTNEPHLSNILGCFDYKGKDYRAQLQLGSSALFGASYIQSVSPNLSLGGELFWSGQHRKSGIGCVARYTADKMIAAAHIANTGVNLSYVHRASEKVSLASDLIYNHMSKDVTASFGYDYIMRQCRVRGRIDSNGCVGAFVEERLGGALTLKLSAEVDHRKKDYKFGFGFVAGE